MSDASNFGQAGIADLLSQFHNMLFAIRQALSEVRTGVPVKVIAIHGGGVGKPPTIDVQPLVKQMDGVGNASSHGTIYGVPVARNQGGANAIINDPQVGDLGHMVVSDRDISSVKANSAEANPGSYRRHDLSDGVYHAAMLAVTPTQYIQFMADGVKMLDKNGNTVLMNSTSISLKPGSNSINIFVGGDGTTGSYAPLVTTLGPCLPNIQGRYA